MYSNNYFQAPTQPPRQPSYSLKGRPVSSLEEARALSIDFDGSVFYFPDLANKKIYTKQINMDGTAIYQGVCATFIALTATGVGLTAGQMGTIVITATLISIGTAGIPGAGAIMLLMVLDSIGLQVEAGTAVAGAYAMILGIDAILDMGRTALNVTGDLASTTCVAKSLHQLDESKWD